MERLQSCTIATSIHCSIGVMTDLGMQTIAEAALLYQDTITQRAIRIFTSTLQEGTPATQTSRIAIMLEQVQHTLSRLEGATEMAEATSHRGSVSYMAACHDLWDCAFSILSESFPELAIVERGDSDNIWSKLGSFNIMVRIVAAAYGLELILRACTMSISEAMEYKRWADTYRLRLEGML